MVSRRTVQIVAILLAVMVVAIAIVGIESILEWLFVRPLGDPLVALQSLKH